MSGTVGLQTPQAPAPRNELQRIPLPTGSYQHPSLPLSAQRLLNMFAEREDQGSRVDAALVSTAGLTFDNVYGTGPIWAMNDDLPGRIYIVSGSELYRFRSEITGVFVDYLGFIGSPGIGVLPEFAQMVTIAVGPTAAVICVPPNAYTCTHTEPLNQIGGSFPGASSVAYLDGYFIFTAYENSAKFFISGLLDPANFDALDFAYSDGLTNVISRVITHRGEAWMMGYTGIEVWYDSGDIFPLRRQSGGTINQSVATPKSVATGDNSVFWIGLDSIVYRSAGYKAVRISDHAIEAKIEAGKAINVVTAFTHHQSGHIFYTFTLADETFSYDCSTLKWHNRSSSPDGNGRWRASCSAGSAGMQWLGDIYSGNVYLSDRDSGLDNGQKIIRQAALPILWGGGDRVTMNRVELEMQVGGSGGPGTDLKIEWSDDGGITWNGLRNLDAGGIADLRKRVYTTRLGSFRQRVMRITAHGIATIYAVDASLT